MVGGGVSHSSASRSRSALECRGGPEQRLVTLYSASQGRTLHAQNSDLLSERPRVLTSPDIFPRPHQEHPLTQPHGTTEPRFRLRSPVSPSSPSEATEQVGAKQGGCLVPNSQPTPPKSSAFSSFQRGRVTKPCGVYTGFCPPGQAPVLHTAEAFPSQIGKVETSRWVTISNSEAS